MTKWFLMLAVVGVAIYIYRKKQDQIFDGHRLDKDLKKWKAYKQKMRVLAKEKEGVYSSSIDPYQNMNKYREERENNFCNINGQEIEEILSVDKKIASTQESEVEVDRPRQIVKKKRWRWKGWRRK